MRSEDCISMDMAPVTKLELFVGRSWILAVYGRYPSASTATAGTATAWRPLIGKNARREKDQVGCSLPKNEVDTWVKSQLDSADSKTRD